MRSSIMGALALPERTSFEEIRCYYVCEGSLDQIVTTKCSLLRAKATRKRGFLVYLKESVTNFKTNVSFSKTTCRLLFYLVNDYNPRVYLYVSNLYVSLYVSVYLHQSHCLRLTTLECDTNTLIQQIIFVYCISNVVEIYLICSFSENTPLTQ